MPSLEIKEPVLTIDRLGGDIVFDAQRLQDLLIDTIHSKYRKKAIQKINKNKKNHNTIVDEYDYKEDEIGRVYSELQQLPKEYRNYLLGDDCIEIDFQNCHYQLISQIADKYNVKNDNINYYIQNREECLKKIHEDRNIAKQMYLIAQYGGDMKKIDNKNINGVVEEIKTILVIMNADEN
jgi:DNA repair ATPase RecN